MGFDERIQTIARNLVKIFGAQKTPPKLILSDEINLPKNIDIVKNDALK